MKSLLTTLNEDERAKRIAFSGARTSDDLLYLLGACECQKNADIAELFASLELLESCGIRTFEMDEADKAVLDSKKSLMALAYNWLKIGDKDASDNTFFAVA